MVGGSFIIIRYTHISRLGNFLKNHMSTHPKRIERNVLSNHIRNTHLYYSCWLRLPGIQLFNQGWVQFSFNFWFSTITFRTILWSIIKAESNHPVLLIRHLLDHSYLFTWLVNRCITVRDCCNTNKQYLIIITHMYLHKINLFSIV